MRTVNVTAFRQFLPRYLALAQRGVRVRLTSRGAVIAELVPALPEVKAAAQARAALRRSVRRYVKPTAPVIREEEWESFR